MKANLLVSPQAFATGEVLVEGDSYRHLFRARRLASGDTLRCVDGQGEARWGTIESVDRSSARVRFGDRLPSFESECRVTLWVAQPKGDRASWLVEKATELGVARIVFLTFARSDRYPSPRQIERLERVARAAVEQCGRSFLPRVEFGGALPDQLGRLGASSWLLDPTADADGVDHRAESTSLVIGPEGGLSGEETEALLQRGARPIGLGPRILRTETAAVIAAGRFLT